MIRVSLHHRTVYAYDRKVSLGPQTVRLRPAPHCRTPIESYSLQVSPTEHFINWQQDPHSNYLARLVFPEPTRHFEIDVSLVAEMTTINPFDFFLEAEATQFPFEYPESLTKDLRPFREPLACGPQLTEFLSNVDRSARKTIDFLVQINAEIQQLVKYVIRMEPGVQTPEETLGSGSGSCRDSAWLLVQVLRNLGMAARFVSGYLIQLKPDVESLDGPSGAEQDFTDLHAWTEVFLPGAGWIGLDPTSGLLAGEGHLPLACTPEPVTAAPITGTVGLSDVQFHHEMSVSRIHEDPRVTKPYTDEQWDQIEKMGSLVDSRLQAGDVRLTMGGEPTFVSIDDMEGEEWKTAAVGPDKRRLAGSLIRRLHQRFGKGGLIHYGQGKWYPGESLPRWALTCLWRPDGEPVWIRPDLLADPDQPGDDTVDDATRFAAGLAEQLGVNPLDVTPAHEDALYYVWKEQRLPVNCEVQNADLDDAEERLRLARVYEQGLNQPVGCLLPLQHQWWNAQPRWVSGRWPIRAEQMFLIPGDSPMGLRLPLDSVPKSKHQTWPLIPFGEAPALPEHVEWNRRLETPTALHQPTLHQTAIGQPALDAASAATNHFAERPIMHQGQFGPDSNSPESSPMDPSSTAVGVEESENRDLRSDDDVIRTAICVEPRNGILHVFMPPVEKLESYLELLAAIERTAIEQERKILIEGYLPPPDSRLQQVKVTPDPGVIEVNTQPTASWPELVDVTAGLYEDARQSRLGTEKFDVDGTHTGTGGGNHIVLGGKTPADSPFLRRPDLLKSFLAYWHNHPSLSYLFSSRFVGPTSQAPRVDEGRRDAVYELQIAFEQIPESETAPPWLVDRVFRHLLVDLTGNTHRAEFCIDKLFSPDSVTGRLGLVEFRAFEMPPHWQMSLTQQLLIRALVARFWEQPYHGKLVDWNTSIHDRWLLPHFLQQDFGDVISELRAAGFEMDKEWFAPHFEFRFQSIGKIESGGVQLELRNAIEPWYVLGEEQSTGGTARFVDSSVERLQIKASGMIGDRHLITCNGRKVPLHPTGTEGEYVAGIRYRAWQPPSCLHPTIPVDHPLTFDIVDTWHARAIGGCQYHVGHPGGLNPESFPINGLEAESRRAARFFQFGHTCGPVEIPDDEPNPLFPMTLDLRRNRISN